MPSTIYRASRPIFFGPGAGFVRAYNTNDFIPSGVVELRFLYSDVYTEDVEIPTGPPRVDAAVVGISVLS